MNRAYDYNGVLVSASRPKTLTRTVKKTIHIDSGDRDTYKYYTNGDFWVYLPRTYQQVISIRLKDAQFPPLVATATVSGGAATHSFSLSGSNGQNIPSATYSADRLVTAPAPYFLIGLEGLNKVDETTVNANRSTYSDSFFAKIPATATAYGASTFINYNDHSALENIATFSPPIENLDRLHITARLHSQQDKSGFLYWTTDGAVAAASGAGTNVGTGADFNLTFEIEYLDNGFSDFSSMETRLAEMR